MSENIIDKANEELSVAEEEPQSLEEFLDRVEENPSSVSHSVKYILQAIEYWGKREVVDRGETIERYCFFDDPYGNGEHAVLGNTRELNAFVEQLRRMASKEGENDKIIWFLGPTASGKSELKRCLINGIAGYSRTEEGQTYTIEWNINSSESGGGLTYGQETGSGDWYESPIGVNPLSVLPENTREEFLEEINEDEKYPVSVDTDIDPFSQEAFEHLKKLYADEGVDNLFEKVTDEKHLRVVRRQMELGSGIGVLHAEDGGSEKQRLVGSWMNEMMREFQSRGRKNPQAFAYDGVLSQGNGGLTLIEDARQHLDAIQRLMNIPEENVVKLDQKIPMDIDTLLMLISNPDLEAELDKFSEDAESDPLRALRRRLDKHEMGYLTSISLEAQLIRRMLLNENDVGKGSFDERMEKAAESIELYDSVFCPRTVEAAAMFDVLTRIGSDSTGMMERYEKALLMDRGYHVTGSGNKLDHDEVVLEESDANSGLPVTYTIDILTDLAQEEEEVLPEDIISCMNSGFEHSSVISEAEVSFYRKRKNEVEEYINQKQEEDVLEAMLREKGVSKKEIENYIDGLFAWLDEDEEEYDPYNLREFEIQYLVAEESDYDGADPKEQVKKYRKKKIIHPVQEFLYDNRDEGFEPTDEIAITECEEIARLLDEQTWEDVERYYENIDLDSWKDPAEGTETNKVKENTVENMIDMFGYTDHSARVVSEKVIVRQSVSDSPSHLTLQAVIDKMEENNGS